MSNTASTSNKTRLPILRATPLTWAYVAFAVAVILSMLSFLSIAQ